MKSKEELIELQAEMEHNSWSGWMQYLFSKCYLEERMETVQKGYFQTGNMVIPKAFVERWKRQMTTTYSELSEQEKESDRIEAIKCYEVFKSEIEENTKQYESIYWAKDARIEELKQRIIEINNCEQQDAEIRSLKNRIDELESRNAESDFDISGYIAEIQSKDKEIAELIDGHIERESFLISEIQSLKEEIYKLKTKDNSSPDQFIYE